MSAGVRGRAGGGAGASELPSWDALAQAAAANSNEAEDATAPRQFLVLRLDGDRYAIPVERVREIVRLRPITKVPRVPKAMCGVLPLRGQIVQVIDARRRMGMSPAEPTRSSRIVVLHGEDGGVTGLLVDAVTDVLRVPEDAIRPAVAGESEAVEALLAHGEEFVSLIDLERVLDLGSDD